jgi:hypothetical protein
VGRPQISTVVVVVVAIGLGVGFSSTFPFQLKNHNIVLTFQGCILPLQSLRRLQLRLAQGQHLRHRYRR